jgi:hypothetical protein
VKHCTQCQTLFEPIRPLQRVCSPMCAMKFGRELTAKRKVKAKTEKKQTRERRAALKRIPDLIREAQTAFNAFIRERDKDQPCICCGKPLGDGEVGGRFDCGHYRSVGSAPNLRFDENNAHGQRKFCNRYGAGRAVDYRRGLIVRIGLEAVEQLEFNKMTCKWTRDELIAIRAMYVRRLKDLQNQTVEG